MSADLPVRSNLSIREAYKEFLNTERGILAYDQFKKILYGPDDSLVQTLNDTILRCLRPTFTDVVNVCDIGGGDGKRIKNILEFLHAKLALTFNLDFVEQSARLMHDFSVEGIASFTQTQRFQTLFEEADLRGGYDFIFFIHSIFAFQNRFVVDKALSLLNSRGSVIAVSNDHDSFLAGLKGLLDKGYNDSRFEIESFIDVLKERGIIFQRIPFQTKWSIHKDCLSQGVDAILDWLSLGRFKDLNENNKREISRYIAKNSLETAQRIIFVENEVIVLISQVA